MISPPPGQFLTGPCSYQTCAVQAFNATCAKTKFAYFCMCFGRRANQSWCHLDFVGTGQIWCGTIPLTVPSCLRSIRNHTYTQNDPQNHEIIQGWRQTVPWLRDTIFTFAMTCQLSSLYGWTPPLLAAGPDPWYFHGWGGWVWRSGHVRRDLCTTGRFDEILRCFGEIMVYSYLILLTNIIY